MNNNLEKKCRAECRNTHYQCLKPTLAIKCQPQTSIPNSSAQVETFVAEKFMVEKFIVEKVMVEMSRVEKSGLKLGVKKSRVEISCNPPEEPFVQRQ